MRQCNQFLRRKSEHLCDLLHIWIIKKTFVDSFFICFYHFLPHCFSLLSVFFLLGHFKVIRCTVKSLIGTWSYFFVEIQLKKKTWKDFFRRQSLHVQTSIPVSPTALICHCPNILQQIHNSKLEHCRSTWQCLQTFSSTN